MREITIRHGILDNYGCLSYIYKNLLNTESVSDVEETLTKMCMNYNKVYDEGEYTTIEVPFVEGTVSVSIRDSEDTYRVYMAWYRAYDN